MSQEKVDYNKKQKQNRKKLVKRQKLQRMAAFIITGVLVVGLGVWIGFSLHTKYEEKKAQDLAENPVYHDIDLSGITDYLNGTEE